MLLEVILRVIRARHLGVVLPEVARCDGQTGSNTRNYRLTKVSIFLGTAVTDVKLHAAARLRLETT